MAFVGGKLSIRHRLAEEAVKRRPAWLGDGRNKVSDDLGLMYDCWMSSDLKDAIKFARKAHEYGPNRVKERLSPDDS
ncbi:hypothetical protein MKK88_12615 [Methylobacterium sp. E-005]|uniref:hypothetical protein n=1 Tax=Methylobacterium sp. E-005 TaxID=2836549 RepID=UPI001FBB92ED|nr:hypothetical protein [Methylobacterium sp. E-005]MCJ2086829.1 hypothetical protein [Methylobacterium sp. E-005]